MPFTAFSLQVRTKLFRSQFGLMFSGTIRTVGINITACIAFIEKLLKHITVMDRSIRNFVGTNDFLLHIHLNYGSCSHSNFCRVSVSSVHPYLSDISLHHSTAQQADSRL